MARLDRGCWQEAQCTLDEALMLARGMPYPYAEARLLHVCAEPHAQRREDDAAREKLAAAQALYQRLGAHSDAASLIMMS
jgi:hypothetical protein